MSHLREAFNGLLKTLEPPRRPQHEEVEVLQQFNNFPNGSAFVETFLAFTDHSSLSYKKEDKSIDAWGTKKDLWVMEGTVKDSGIKIRLSLLDYSGHLTFKLPSGYITAFADHNWISFEARGIGCTHYLTDEKEAVTMRILGCLAENLPSKSEDEPGVSSF